MNPFPPKNERLMLKDTTGWFAAGDSFQNALASLSDGAFKLFAYLCLQADRRTGCFETTHQQLALALLKSNRIIGSYVAELERKSICTVHRGKNQFPRSAFDICDKYWPYYRPALVANRPVRQLL